MKPLLFSVLYACIAMCASLPAFAEEEVQYVDVVERGHFFKSKHFAPSYEKRITAIKEQVDLGVSKGWISSERAESLKGEAGRIMVSVDAIGKKDPTQAEADEIDRSITKLNSDVYQAMQGGSPAPTPAAEPANASSTPDSAGEMSAAPLSTTSGSRAGQMKASSLKPLTARPAKRKGH